jgi:ribosomal protein S18 acetylase RimI-like enzyme
MPGAMRIQEAVSAGDIARVRQLFLEYQSSLDVDLCFQGFREEVEGLPGSYARPSGCLLLAIDGTDAVGCVALRRVTDADGEMKRLYLQPRARGTGLGRRLTERVIDEARRMGYRRILLDTLPSMTRAIELYQALGFVDIGSYRPNPVAGARFLALTLA